MMDLSKYIREDDKIRTDREFSWYDRDYWKGYGNYRKIFNKELEWLRTKVDDKIQLEYYRNSVNNIFDENALKRDLVDDISQTWIQEILFLRSHVDIFSQFSNWLELYDNKSPITNKSIMTIEIYKDKWSKTVGNIDNAIKLINRWNKQIPRVFKSCWDEIGSTQIQIEEFCYKSTDYDNELKWLRDKVGKDKELEYFRDGGSLENELEWLVEQIDKLEYWKWKNHWMSYDEYSERWINHIGDFDYIKKLKEYYDNQLEIPEEFMPKLDNCSICISPIDRDNSKQILKCGHYFHHDCVTRWIDEGKNTCPICRSLIDDTIEETNSSDETEIELERWIAGSNVEEYFVDRITGDVYVEMSDGFTLVGYRMPNSDNGNFIQLLD